MFVGCGVTRRPVWTAHHGLMSMWDPMCPPALQGEQRPSVVGHHAVVMREALKPWYGGLSAQFQPTGG